MDSGIALKYGVTPLMNAAQKGQAGCLKLLIAAGADLNLKSNIGWTALRFAKISKKADCEALRLRLR